MSFSKMKPIKMKRTATDKKPNGKEPSQNDNLKANAMPPKNNMKNTITQTIN